jgi:hypothetical protein
VKILKPLLSIVALLVVGAEAMQIYALTLAAPPGAPADGPAASPATGGAPVGVPQWIDFAADEGTFAGLTSLERRQQCLDWLLFTAASASGLDRKQLQEAFYDLPPLRRGYLEPFANYDYGQVRSRVVGTGDVIALVPRANPAQRGDDLAHIADEQRKELGRIPRSLLVFEYQLDPGLGAATLTRLSPVPGSELFSERAGYVEATISSLPDLQRFLEQIEDVTSVQRVGPRLVLGGRRLQAGPYRGLGVEDVAALWQSEKTLGRNQALVSDFKREWQERTYSTAEEKAQLDRELERELAALRQKLGQPSLGEPGLRVVDSSGFSLDPTFDYRALRELFDKRKELFEDLASERQAPIATSDVDAAGAALRQAQPDEGPFLSLLSKLVQGANPLGKLVGHQLSLEIAQSPCQFQHARYDGELSGTRAGMVLFYTDLLAKLWALDYLSSAPRSEEVEDFVPLLKVEPSPVYIKGIQALSNTRLWFGPRDRGFQLTSEGVLMARNATRVYAASSDPLQPGKEAEPNASSAAFLGWWNDHYDVVARFEPEYERLNEIMKWSTVLGWLSKSGDLDRLGFLSAVHVDRSNWFPTWAKHQSELRYRHWDPLGFYQKGHLGVAAESLPMLRSVDYRGAGMEHYLVGGVSLGGKSLFAERGALTEDVLPALRRSNLDYSASRSEHLITLDKVRYDFSEESAAVTVKPAAKLRDLDVEVPNRTFGFRSEANAGELGVAARLGDDPLGRLAIEHTGNAFSVGFRELDYGEMHAVARRLAEQPGLQVESLLADQRGVAAWIKLDESGREFLVQMKASGRWLKLWPEGAPRVEIAPGVDMRAGGWSGTGGERWNLAWAKADEVAKPLAGQGYLKVEVPASVRSGLSMSANVRGPPGLEPIRFARGDLRVQGWARQQDGGKIYYFKLAELPPELRGAPEALRQLVQPPGASKLAAAISHLQQGSYRAAGGDLASDPVHVKVELDALRRQSLSEADRLLASGRASEAGQELDTLVQIYGSDPELLSRRAIAALRAGNPAGAAADVEAAAAAGARDAGPFADSVLRLAADAAAEAKPRSLERLAAYADLRQRIGANGMKARAEPLLAADGGLDFQLTLLDRLPPPRPIRPAEVQRGVLYVDADDPTFANVDPSNPQPQVIDALVSHEIVASELHSWEIVHTAPQEIHDAATGHRFRLASHLARPDRYISLRNQSCNDPLAHGRPECDGSIYLVRRAPSAVAARTQAGP